MDALACLATTGCLEQGALFQPLGVQVSWRDYRPSSANEIRFHCTAKSPKITIKNGLNRLFFRSEFLKNSIVYRWRDYRPLSANENQVPLYCKVPEDYYKNRFNQLFFRSEFLKNSTAYSRRDYKQLSANEIRFHCTAKSPKITIKTA